MTEQIYFDNNSTTRVDDRVLESMLPFFTKHYGNASSRLHAFGWQAEAAVERARTQVAGMIGADASEIIFTSGATEAINMALVGAFKAYSTKGNHIITVKTEHKAVLDTCAFLENEDAEVTYLNVDKEGMVDLTELKSSVKPETILICVMAANNETGVIQPIEEIAEVAKNHKVIFFSDATQYAGKMQLNVPESGIHALSLSAHKFHGPKGIGALYIKRKDPRVNVLPLIHGGGQERGLRAGTLNVPLIVGLGKACELAAQEYWDNNTYVSKLRAFFEHHVLDLEGLRINGSTRNRLYNTSNVTFPSSIDMKPLLHRFAFSSGSACTSGTLEPSHVLLSMGSSEEEVKRSYRFSFSKYNSQTEIEHLVNTILKK